MNKDVIDKLLTDALEKEPEIRLSASFSDQVLKKIRAGRKKEQRKLVLIYVVAIFGFTLSGLAGIFYFGGIGMLRNLVDVGSWTVFIGVIVVLVQYLDSRLVRKKLSDSLL